MAHVGAAQILGHGRRHGYGVPCLLAGNLEMMIGAVAAAQEANAPLILAYNAAVTPMIPMKIAAPAMVQLAADATVPVATILDHGLDLENVARAIDLGLSTVMFDGSHLPYAENVRQTRAVVRLAHAAGVDVEGELGAIGGSSAELGSGEAAGAFTDPALVREFAAETGVDVLAISFGNRHGVYGAVPMLDLDRVRTIAADVDTPLAMHGASGLADDLYAAVIDAGVSKINYYTSMARAVTKRLCDRLQVSPEFDLVYHHVIEWSTEEFRVETGRLLAVLGAEGQAT